MSKFNTGGEFGERLATVLQAQTLARTSYSMIVRNVFLALTFNGAGILFTLNVQDAR